MIFIDSNIPMYLIGAPHPLKAEAKALLDRSIANRDRLVTDVEVFQEILHRYVAIRRHDAIQPAFDLISAVTDDVFPIDEGVVQRAKTIVLERPTFSARDAVHLAVMEAQGITRILSFDSAFDAMPGIDRLRL